MFFQNLDKLDLLKNTIAVTNDYGGVCGAHQWNQETMLYEEVMNVPFILFWLRRKMQEKFFRSKYVPKN